VKISYSKVGEPLTSTVNEVRAKTSITNASSFRKVAMVVLGSLDGWESARAQNRSIRIIISFIGAQLVKGIIDSEHNNFQKIEARNEIVNKIKSFEHLTDGWDGYRGTRPGPQAVVLALEIVSGLSSEITLQAFPIPFGGIQLEFDFTKDTYIEIEIVGSTASIYRITGKEGFTCENLKFADTVIEYIKSFASES